MKCYTGYVWVPRPTVVLSADCLLVCSEWQRGMLNCFKFPNSFWLNLHLTATTINRTITNTFFRVTLGVITPHQELTWLVGDGKIIQRDQMYVNKNKNLRTCESRNPKIHSINCIAYVLKKIARKGQYLPFLLSMHLKTGSKQLVW